MNSVTRGLIANGHSVKVLTMCSDKHPFRIDALPAGYAKQTGIEAVKMDLSIKPLDAAMALLCGESYNVKRFISKDFRAKLEELLKAESFDIIHLESIFLAPYLEEIRRLSNAGVVLRAHNVENKIWRQMALATKNPLKRWYLKKLALALRLYELEMVNKFDGIACIAGSDAEYFRENGCRRPITVVPFGIEPRQNDDIEEEPNTLFHIGSMDWRPNEEGIRWFLSDVWPLVHSQLPKLHLYLAGRKMPQDLMQMEMEGVTVVGEVEDAYSFMASKQINIVPLLSGSGIRVKIIEAMSMGKTVISTSVGHCGIETEGDSNLLTANTPRDFVEQLRRCYEEPTLCKTIGDNARRHIAENYDNDKLARRLGELYSTVRRTMKSDTRGGSRI